MSKIDVVTPSGSSAGSTELDEAMFAIEPNVAAMHQVVTAQLAARRSGSHHTLTRREVRGGGAKPWKQKGTGRARAGSSNMPNWRGGGVAMGPKPRDYSQRTPKKMKRLALRSALSDRAAEGKVLVVDAWTFEGPKTKDANAALNAIGAEGNVLVVVDRSDEAAWMSFRNLASVHIVSPAELNTYDILVSDVVVFTKDNLPVAPAAKVKAKPDIVDAVEEPPAEVEAVEEAPVEEPVEEDAVSVMESDQPTVSESSADADSDAVNPDDDSPFGEGSAHPGPEGAAPGDEYTIKGNADSMLYHPPESPFYGRTVAEVWFTTAEAAEAAGFNLPPSMQKDEQ